MGRVIHLDERRRSRRSLPRRPADDVGALDDVLARLEPLVARASLSGDIPNRVVQAELRVVQRAVDRRRYAEAALIATRLAARLEGLFRPLAPAAALSHRREFGPPAHGRSEPGSAPGTAGCRVIPFPR